MKIAQVCARFSPHIGGVETHVKEISKRLVAKGVDLVILSMDYRGDLPQEERIDGVHVKRFKSWAPTENYILSRELRAYLMEKSDEYDIVHAQGYTSFGSLYAAQTKANNKLILTSHYHQKGGTSFRSVLRSMYDYYGIRIFKKSDAVVCVSNYEKSLLIKHFKVDEEKIAVIPNGFNLDEFRLAKEKKSDDHVILCVSRLEHYKGIQYLINVLPKLDDDVILEIVGEGAYKESLIKMAKQQGVEKRVNFFSALPRPELLRKYANADLFVLLSEQESYGICVGEALASGTPCIVANSSALTEWVDSSNCFGIDIPANLHELSNLIKKVMGKTVMGVKLPDWNETTEELISVYENSLSKA